MKQTLLIVLTLITLHNVRVEGQTNHHYRLYDYSLDSNQRQIHLSALTADGGMVVVTGNEYRANISLFDYGLSMIRFDANGNKLWNNFVGGYATGNVNYLRIMELPDNGFAIAGNAAGINGGFILKTDANGNFIFMKNYSYELYDLVLDPSDNGFLITTNQGNTQSGIIKTDASGVIMWSDARNIVPDPDHYYMAKRLSNGNYLTVGVAYDNPSLLYGSGIVACYNASGILLWTNSYGGPEWVTGFKNFTELPDGTVLLAGISSTFMVNGTRTLIANIDSLGNVIWCKSSGQNANISNFSFEFADEFIYAAGSYEVGGAIVRPSVIKLNSAGEVNWARIYPELEWPADITYGSSRNFSIVNEKMGFNNYKTFCSTDTALSQSCSLYDTTFAMNTAALVVTTIVNSTPGNPLIAETTVLKTNSPNVNFVKNDVCALSAISSLAGNSSQMLVYPNPAKESINIAGPAEVSKGMKFLLLNTLGETVKTLTLTLPSTTIQLQGLQSGLYFYLLQNQQNVWESGKLVIE